MADNVFLFSTMAQVNYFSQVGRLIAQKNNNEAVLNMEANSDKEKALCIHIPDSYGQAADLLSAVRRAWRIDGERCTKPSIKCIFAIVDKTIVGVYEFSKNENISKVIESYENGRKELNIEVANLELQIKYLGRKIDLEATRQPIRYVYVDDVVK